jgi:hypothetical protein
MACVRGDTMAQGASVSTVEGTVATSGKIGLAAASSADYVRLITPPSSPADLGMQRSATFAQGGFSDWLTIQSPDRSGGGQLTFVVDWSFTHALDTSTANAVTGVAIPSLAAAFVDARLRVEASGTSFFRSINDQVREDFSPTGSTPIVQKTSTFAVNGLETSLSEVQGKANYTVGFTYDTPFQLAIDSVVYTYAQASGIASASATFSSLNSVDWGGILSVTDDQGNAITDFTATSASGFDYTNAITPVPEPSVLAMLMAGLGVVGMCARRRRL